MGRSFLGRPAWHRLGMWERSCAVSFYIFLYCWHLTYAFMVGYWLSLFAWFSVAFLMFAAAGQLRLPANTDGCLVYRNVSQSSGWVRLYHGARYQDGLLATEWIENQWSKIHVKLVGGTDMFQHPAATQKHNYNSVADQCSSLLPVYKHRESIHRGSLSWPVHGGDMLCGLIADTQAMLNVS